jgi:beta-lactamase class A/uncharacterized membrane protein YphA (DoxX/SURF4 family)
MGLVVVRIALGVFFLFEGIDKIGWFADSDLLTETLKGWLFEAPSLSRWYLENVAIPAAPLFARLVPLGELGSAVALLLGFRIRLAAVLAFLMVLNFHLASGALFRYGFLTNGYALPVLGGLAGLFVHRGRLPWSLALVFLLAFSACEVRAPHEETAEPVSLETELTRALDALSAKSSLHAKHLPSGREIAIRADEPMNTLSVIKIPIMVLAYRDAEAGKLDLDARYTLRPEDRRRGSGLLQTFAPGLSPTYRDLVTQMIVTSDNSATDLLIARLGLDRVNSLLEEAGFKDTRLLRTTGDLFRRVWELQDPKNSALSPEEVFDRGFPSGEGAFERSFTFDGDPKEWLGSTTARETSRLLEQIHAGAIASRASCDEMIEILRQQFYSSRLPRFLPDEVEAAHKTGDWPPIAGNDVGILFHPGGPTIVSIYVHQNRTDFNRVEETHGEIARRLVEAWGQRDAR